MAYQKQTWEDLPSTNTPITATRLNHIENGIADVETGLTPVTSYTETDDKSYACNYINNNIQEIGTTLYETNNPSKNQTLTLTDNIANYKRLIIYSYDDEIENDYTTEVFNNNSSTINFMMRNGTVGYSTNSVHLTFINVSISGTTLTKGKRTYINDAIIGPVAENDNNYKYAMIKKIVAYKN